MMSAPFFGQPYRVAAALTASGAGDESDLAFDSSSHISPLVLLGLGESGNKGGHGLPAADRRRRDEFRRRPSRPPTRGSVSRISSSAMRPSSLASALPRQKCVPTPKVMCWSLFPVDVEASPSGRTGGGRGWRRRPASTLRCPRARSVRSTRRRGSRSGRCAERAVPSAASLRPLAGCSAGFVDEFAALIGVFGQHLARPADQTRGGLGARGGDHVAGTIRSSSRVSRALCPVSSANSALSSSVMMSSEGARCASR